MRQTRTATYPLRYLARFTIEFTTPFIVGGGDDLFFDDMFMADANGIPALPGSSLAGVLRHASVDAGISGVDAIFGFQDGNGGEGSRLSVSWGCLHDKNNLPVEGLSDAETIGADPVLAESLLLTARDHVRIGHRGSAEDHGKFDERSVSAGHRFTFELELEGNEADRTAWESLLAIACGDEIRIGGKTRRGYGAFKVVSLRTGLFDLATAEGFVGYCSHPVQLVVTPSLKEVIPPVSVLTGAARTATLRLKPEGFWMIGGGSDPGSDLSPLTASRIVWDEKGKGGVEQSQVVVPGSSVKGVLAHRVAFHYNAISGVFADSIGDPAEIAAACGRGNEAVRELFGYCKEQDEDGRRGRVIISDLYVADPGTPKKLNHVSIDRFSGGARTLEGALFDELPFYRGPGFELKVVVTQWEAIPERAQVALKRALEDLAEGRLAIGAGAGRGNGYFRAADGVDWHGKEGKI